MSFSSDKPLQANQLPISYDFPPPDDKEFLQALTLSYKRSANSINSKEGALYFIQEQANFHQWFKYSDPATFTPDPTRFRNGYRTVFDLVALNGGPIGAAAAPVLTTTTQPPLINGILIPTRGYGAGTIAGPIYVFFNGDDVNIRFDNTNPAAQVIRITNNTGTTLTQAYWVMEYLKEN